MSAPEVRELHPRMGAEVLGIDVSRRLDDDEVRFVREAFDRYGFVVFRDTDLDRTRQAYLCELLMGRHVPTEAESIELAQQQGSYFISNQRDDGGAPFGSLMFHVDSPWSAYPNEVLSLYGEEVHQPSVPTRYASAVAAWKALPDSLKETLQGLDALNVCGPEYVPERRRTAFDGQLVQTRRSHTPSHVWPAVRSNPRTGEPVVYVCQQNTGGFVGMDPEASEDLMEEVFSYLYAPENIFELEWQEGQLIIWDNFSIHHGRAQVDTDGPGRTLRKIGLPLEPDLAAVRVDKYESIDAS
jgi:alpha-ketoglutarate-dependent taurine dioxygenase